jgi:hypothetical protein
MNLVVDRKDETGNKEYNRRDLLQTGSAAILSTAAMGGKASATPEKPSSGKQEVVYCSVNLKYNGIGKAKMSHDYPITQISVNPVNRTIHSTKFASKRVENILSKGKDIVKSDSYHSIPEVINKGRKSEHIPVGPGKTAKIEEKINYPAIRTKLLDDSIIQISSMGQKNTVEPQSTETISLPKKEVPVMKLGEPREIEDGRTGEERIIRKYDKNEKVEVEPIIRAHHKGSFEVVDSGGDSE